MKKKYYILFFEWVVVGDVYSLRSMKSKEKKEYSLNAEASLQLEDNTQVNVSSTKGSTW